MFEPRTELALPFQEDKLLEVRTSKMKKMSGVDVMTGIDKTLCNSPMHVTKLGIEGDEHDLTFHGGVDKAVLGCKDVTGSSCLNERFYSLTLSRLLVSLPGLASFLS